MAKIARNHMHENECRNAESVIPLRTRAVNPGPFEALMKAAKGIKEVEYLVRLRPISKGSLGFAT